MRLRLVEWDMAKCQKTKGDNVLHRLEGIAANLMRHTGYFHSRPQLYCNSQQRRFNEAVGGLGYAECGGLYRNQAGVVRVNCVDCLDRTNTAQYVLGLNALRHQLHALGVIAEPTPACLPFGSQACRLLEELYEDHGDTIAVQYGGSQLVNRVETYRKSAPWTSHSRDILNTITRYYSNSFTDVEKQAEINVFLGIFRPVAGEKQLWELENDYFLHCPEYTLPTEVPRPLYTSWLDVAPVPFLNRFQVALTIPNVTATNNNTNNNSGRYITDGTSATASVGASNKATQPNDTSQASSTTTATTTAATTSAEEETNANANVSSISNDFEELEEEAEHAEAVAEHQSAKDREISASPTFPDLPNMQYKPSGPMQIPGTTSVGGVDGVVDVGASGGTSVSGTSASVGVHIVSSTGGGIKNTVAMPPGYVRLPSTTALSVASTTSEPSTPSKIDTSIISSTPSVGIAPFSPEATPTPTTTGVRRRFDEFSSRASVATVVDQDPERTPVNTSAPPRDKRTTITHASVAAVGGGGAGGGGELTVTTPFVKTFSRPVGDNVARVEQLRKDYDIIRELLGEDKFSFNAKVREVYASWHPNGNAKGMQPIDFMRAALFLAARQGMQFSTETTVPRQVEPVRISRSVSLLDDFYNRSRLTPFDDMHSLQMTTTARLHGHAAPLDYSPFKGAPRGYAMPPSKPSMASTEDNDSEGGNEEDSISLMSVDAFQLLVLNDAPPPTTTTTRSTLTTMKEKYGVALLPPTPEKIAAFGKGLDIEGIGASLMSRTQASRCAQSFRAISHPFDDPRTPSVLDPLGTQQLAALTGPPREIPRPRQLPPPTHYSTNDFNRSFPTAYSKPSDRDMEAFKAHVAARENGSIIAPKLNPFLQYKQAPLAVLDTLTQSK